jgi:hypothetical protein
MKVWGDEGGMERAIKKQYKKGVAISGKMGRFKNI